MMKRRTATLLALFVTLSVGYIASLLILGNLESPETGSPRITADYLYTAVHLKVDLTPDFHTPIEIQNRQNTEVLIMISLTDGDYPQVYPYPYIDGTLSMRFITTKGGERITEGIKWNFSSTSFRAFLNEEPVILKLTLTPEELEKGEYNFAVDVNVNQEFKDCKPPPDAKLAGGWWACVETFEADGSTVVRLIII